MAWLHATPKPDPTSRRGKAALAEGAPPPLSRMEQMKADGYSLTMPPNPAPLILDRLIEIGLTEAVGMGVGPLSWFSINEWQKSVRVVLSPWETRLIRRLSLAYLEEKRLSESENHPPPWRGVVIRH